MSPLLGQAWRCRNPSIDSISSGLQESDISIRILSEIKIRTDEDSSESSFLAASCSDGSLTRPDPVQIRMPALLLQICGSSIPS